MQAKTSKPWLIPVIVAAVVVIASLLYFQLQVTGEEQQTPAEIQAQLERVYGGKVLSMEQQQDSFLVELEKEDGIYEIEANATYGNVTQITRLTTTETTEPTTTPTDTEEPSEPQQPGSRLTEEQAVELALKEVSGTLEDVDFEDSEQGGFYLIEIEQPGQGDEDGQEATVQIQAITGEVLSIVWDD